MLPHMAQAPLLLKACLNGSRSRDEHPAVPHTPEELARDARAVVDVGAGAVHVHPRGTDARETLDPGACGAAVAAIREAVPRLPVGLSTGAWIEPDLARRTELISRWDPRPDFASVNLSEDRWLDVARALLDAGIGVEAGMIDTADAGRLAGSGIAGRCLRVLVEPIDQEPADAEARARAIDDTLDSAGITLPRLHHGFGGATWAVLEAAIASGRDIRVGLEDTLVLPDGGRARDNAELVAAAAMLYPHP